MPRPLRLLLPALLVAGAAAAAFDASRRAPPRPDPAAPWRLLDPDGRPTAAIGGGRTTLAPDHSVSLLAADGPPVTVRSTRVVAVPQHEGSTLELRWIVPGGAERVVTLSRRRVAVGHRRFSEAQVVESAGAGAAAGSTWFDPAAPVTFDVRFEGGDLVVLHEDRRVLTAPSHVRPGRFLATARGRPWVLRGLLVEGVQDPDGAARPMTRSTRFDEALPPGRARAAAARLGVCLVLALLAAAFLRLLAATRPPVPTLARATGRLLLPAALLVLAGVALGSAPSPVALAAAAFVGLLPALFTLRAHLKAEALEPPPAALACLGIAALAAAAWVAGDWKARFHEQERRHERRAVATPSPPAWRLDEATELGPANAVLADSSWRDVTFSTRASIEPGGVLQLRTRGAPEGKPYGVSLFLSTDPRLESGFYEEGRIRFSRLGPGAGVVPAGTPLEVVVETRGRSFRATVDGRVLATARCRRHASGGVAALAARGRATLLEARVTPDARAPTEDASATPGAAATIPEWPDRLRGATAPVLFLLAYAALLRRRRRVSFGRALAAGGLGLLPLAAALPGLSPSGAVEPALLAVALVASAVLLVLLPTVQSRACGRLRRFGVLALVAVAGGLLLDGLLERAWPPTANERNALPVDAWEGVRLEADLLHLTHPLLRRWQRYLGDHSLRGRRPALEKRPGRTRVLFLGTSSTYGYRVRVPYGFHVERALAAEGRPAEAIVGAVEGSSGARLRYVLENTLAAYEPDVLCVSLGFNDSVVLCQIDERAYLARVTAPGYRRGALERWTTRARHWLASRRLAASMSDEAAAPNAAFGGEGDRPADRFERILRDFAAFCAARGVALVLVKEPCDRTRIDAHLPQVRLAPDFHAAMDRVAREFGFVTVDPAPLLEERGGRSLFMDAVHPTEVGHEVMAEALLPALRGLVPPAGR